MRSFRPGPCDEAFYEVVRRVPAGHVATYGQIAFLAGHPGAARAVGNALHQNPDPERTPCFRIVDASGRLSGAFAFGGAGEQQRRLEEDGVTVTDGRVDLVRYGWHPVLSSEKKQ